MFYLPCNVHVLLLPGAFQLLHAFNHVHLLSINKSVKLVQVWSSKSYIMVLLILINIIVLIEITFLIKILLLIEMSSFIGSSEHHHKGENFSIIAS